MRNKTDWMSYLGFVTIGVYTLFWHTKHGVWKAFHWPALDNIPLLKRIVDAGYLENDFLTNAYTNSPREPFVYLVLTLKGMLFSEWYEVFYLLKMILLLVSIGLLFLAISSFIPLKNRIIFQMSFVLFSFFSHDLRGVAIWTYMNTYPPMIYEPTAHAVASLWISLGLIFIAGNLNIFKVVVSLFSFSIGAIIHPAVGLCGVFFLFLLLLASEIPRKFKRLMLSSAAVGVGVVCIQFLYAQTSAISLSEFIRIYIIERHPHHFFMSYVWKLEYARYILTFVLLITPGLFSVYIKSKGVLKMSFIFALGFVVFPVAQYYFIEIYPLRSVAVAGLVRFHMYSFWMVATVWSYFFSELFLYFLSRSIVRRACKSHMRIPYRVLSISVLFLTLLIGYKKINRNPWELLPSANQEMLDWLKNQTSSSAVVAVRNPALDTFHIRIFAERAVFADDGFPFQEKLIAEWRERKHGIEIKNGQVFIRGKFKVDFIVLTHEEKISCLAVFENAIGVVYRLEHCLKNIP